MNRGPRLVLWSLLWLIAGYLIGFAAESEKFRPLVSYRSDTPPVIDGLLDDPVWTQAPTETGFKTWRL